MLFQHQIQFEHKKYQQLVSTIFFLHKYEIIRTTFGTKYEAIDKSCGEYEKSDDFQFSFCVFKIQMEIWSIKSQHKTEMKTKYIKCSGNACSEDVCFDMFFMLLSLLLVVIFSLSFCLSCKLECLQLICNVVVHHVFVCGGLVISWWILLNLSHVFVLSYNKLSLVLIR